MREIKFRVRDKKENKWIDNEIFIKKDGTRYEAVQFTGLKDKNKKEIYEGDILKQKQCDGVFSLEIVSWSDGAFELTDKYVNHYRICNAEIRGEVIGNIYENPELLKEKNDITIRGTMKYKLKEGDDLLQMGKGSEVKDLILTQEDAKFIAGFLESPPCEQCALEYGGSVEWSDEAQKETEKGLELAKKYFGEFLDDEESSEAKGDETEQEQGKISMNPSCSNGESVNPEPSKSIQDEVNIRILRGMLSSLEIKGIIFSADRDLLFEALLSKFNYIFLRVPGSKTIIMDIIGEDMKYKIINEFAKTFNLNFTTDWERIETPKPKPSAPDNQIEFIDEFADVKEEDLKKMKQLLPEIEELVISKGGRFIPRTHAPLANLKLMKHTFRYSDSVHSDECITMGISGKKGILYHDCRMGKSGWICICGGKPDAWKGAEEAIEETCDLLLVNDYGFADWQPIAKADWKKVKV